MASSDRVVAAVVTYNRKGMLLECLESLARQEHPVDRVVVVDNASTDGTPEAIVESGVGSRIAIDYVRCERNGGASEGFHYAIRHARSRDADWIWVMDDDCEAPERSLSTLLAHPRARDAQAAVLAPAVRDAEHRLLPLNRGWLRPRWFLGPLVPMADADFARDELCVDHVSFVGMLVRMDAARRVDPPKRDLFIWWDDLEWCLRLREAGRLWVTPGAEIIHKDPRPVADTGLRARLADFSGGVEFRAGWKWCCGVRNLVFCGRRHGFMNAGQAAAFTLVSIVRALLADRRRLRLARLMAAFARDGWRGRFRNVPPAEWTDLAEARDPLAALSAGALTYERETDTAPRTLDPAAGR